MYFNVQITIIFFDQINRENVGWNDNAIYLLTHTHKHIYLYICAYVYLYNITIQLPVFNEKKSCEIVLPLFLKFP